MDHPLHVRPKGTALGVEGDNDIVGWGVEAHSPRPPEPCSPNPGLVLAKEIVATKEMTVCRGEPRNR